MAVLGLPEAWAALQVAAAVAMILVGLNLLAAVKHRRWQMEVKRTMEAQGFYVLPCMPVIGNAFHMAKLTRAAYRSQAMETPSLLFLHRVSPPFWHWYTSFGPRFVSWQPEPCIPLLDPELVRQVLFAKADANGKSDSTQKVVEGLVGRGIVVANGDDWLQQRQVVGPAFHVDSLKQMVVEMAKSAEECVHSLREILTAAGKESRKDAEIDVMEHMGRVTADIISRTAFGGSYETGKHIFGSLEELLALSVANFKFLLIPGYKWLPVSANRKLWRLKKSISSNLHNLIDQRRESMVPGSPQPYGKDLLGLVLAAASGQQPQQSRKVAVKFDNQLLIDECKTFFVAGQETTTTLLSWTMLLLSLHPEWQHKVREEAMEVCQGAVPHTYDALCKLKMLGMVINETLRLYTPVPNIKRQAFRDTQIGDLFIPKGVCLLIPLHVIHRDKKLWGVDADEFKPDRFRNGIAQACKHPMGFNPFSNGPRNCLGGTFTMLEAKIILAALLQNFTFTLSPNYKHAPMSVLTLKPQFGLQLLIQPYQKDNS